ncbi:MAG: hypothetical protein ACREV4_16595 [Gammaproteobacteria bacterium]
MASETMTESIPSSQAQVPEPQLVEILSHHYGDGFVYLLNASLEAWYKVAIAKGYVSDDGYLTRKGRALLASYHYA